MQPFSEGELGSLKKGWFMLVPSFCWRPTYSKLVKIPLGVLKGHGWFLISFSQATPLKLNMLELKISPWKRRYLLKTIHLRFQGLVFRRVSWAVVLTRSCLAFPAAKCDKHLALQKERFCFTNSCFSFVFWWEWFSYTWAKNPPYFPLYWLVNRDPYNGLL